MKSVGIPFFCYSHPRTLTAEMIDLLADAGCTQIKVGIQTFAPEICQNILHRPPPGEKIIQLRGRLRERGMALLVDHMLGLPNETEAQIIEAVDKYLELAPDSISTFFLVYFPGAEIIAAGLESGQLDPAQVEAINEGLAGADIGTPSPGP
jgi:anaerobic magnesium-protoporphyrin IX monomethyl ester cyclase